jgi:hypothetical protein
MNDKLLERLSSGRKVETLSRPSASADDPAADDHGYFGVLRGVGDRAVMLELRRRNGNILAVAYSWIERVEFDPSDGIKLFACGWEISISGRSLNEEVRPNLRLFESITQHRVPWLREADEDEVMQTPESAIIIEEIGWKGFRR